VARPGADPRGAAERVEHDPDALGLLFEWSQAELLERYLDDPRLRSALMGQGVIGTNASPFDPGTASIHFHHSSGRIDPDLPGTWGFVEGGMGTVSFLLHDAAVEAGAVVAAGVPVAAIVPEEGCCSTTAPRSTPPSSSPTPTRR
jgi:phytoene dehydrogenase-like protein